MRRTQAVPKPKQPQRKHATARAGVGNRTKKGGSGGGGKGGGGDAVAVAVADADASKRKPERAMAPSGKGRKRRKAEAIRPLAAPVPEPGLEIPEVSEADVGKMVLSETGRVTLTGVIEKFVERDGLGVWSIRWVRSVCYHARILLLSWRASGTNTLAAGLAGREKRCRETRGMIYVRRGGESFILESA